MVSASDLLFDTIYNGKPLFISQVDLAQSLLNNTESAYYIPDAQSDEYKRSLNKLKVFISQLLSPSGARNLTSLFRHSIKIVVEERLAGTGINADEVVSKILLSLENKNRRPENSSNEISSRSTTRDLFFSIAEATDVLVITARPFDISPNNSRYSLQQFLILDFVNHLANPERKLKRYRFNFPLKQIGDLFWFGFKKALDIEVAKLLFSKANIERIYLQSLIQADLYNEVISTTDYSKETISKISESIITFLNVNFFVSVYIVDEPIFSVPMIILNPNARSSPTFVIIENESNNTVVNKLGVEDTVLWKFLVWDRIKTKRSGKFHEFHSNYSY